MPRHAQLNVLELFATEVIPLMRREVSTTLWGPDDPGRAAGLSLAEDRAMNAA